MQGHCWFALRVGNAAWHTVNSMVRETHHRWSEGKRYRLNKLSTTDSRLLICGIQSLLSFVYIACFTNTLTKPPTSGYEVEVVKHTLATTLAKFMLQWERRGTFISFCYLNSLMFWVMEKVYFAYLNMDLMKVTHPGLRECVQCMLILGSVFMQVVGMRSKKPRGFLDIRYVFFFICTTIFVLLEREKCNFLDITCSYFNGHNRQLSVVLWSNTKEMLVNILKYIDHDSCEILFGVINK